MSTIAPIERLFALGLPPVRVAEVVGVTRQAARLWQAGETQPTPTHQLKAKKYLASLPRSLR